MRTEEETQEKIDAYRAHLATQDMERDARTIALALSLGLDTEDIEDIEASAWDESTLCYGTQEYLVLTDAEADDKWDEGLEQYIDDVIMPDMDEHIKAYFDSEKWKRDAEMDGRAHVLATYDGDEDFEDVDGETYYIYRLN